MSLGGLALPGQGVLRASPEVSLSEKSVIFLFLHGGPSQIETFDPHPEAPVETRSATGHIPTALPGVQFGASFPKLAKLADRLAIVRSYVPGDANHDIKPVVCKETAGANLGSAFARMEGGNHPATGMPRNIALFPRCVEPTAQAEQRGFGNFLSPGMFGAAAVPFVPGGTGQFQKDMKLALPVDRFDDRRSLLTQLDRAKESLDQSQQSGHDIGRDKACRMLLGGVADAFDLSREDSKTIARYDTAPLVRPENIDKKWKNYNHYCDNSKTLGKLLLLARRLCERGAGFVTVTTNFVWDMHADVNNATMTEGMSYMAPPLDHAVSAFVEDLEARGLSEKILLVCCGEMGRTPKINGKGGRDHWGNLGPLLLAGGGLNMGQVIGRSARNGGEPNSDPVTIKHLVGTVMNTLFDVGKLRVVRGLPREIQQMAEADPIPNLFGRG
ncbi:DUF1501 domain-containing protein [Zavarzinella formosa]|uniref:DUF1501 domain-containing protein n=1 Tax=Zavarzinella formosa TaxID=360055 RepID=UPI001EE63C54|nr:DUF1501 domain-containing protein [Zavarzinella formosa]